MRRLPGAVRTVGDIVAGILIIGSIVVLLNRHDERDHEEGAVADVAPGTTLSLAGMPILGSDSAPVVMVEFSDYQCRFCIRFSRETFPRIHERLIATGRVAYAFGHTPAKSRHPLAWDLSKAAVCAGRQGLFWEAHERLFGVGAGGVGSPETALADLGLDQRTHTRCLAEPSVDQAVRSSLETAIAVGVSGTPTFFVGRRTASGDIRWMRRIRGARSFDLIEGVVGDVADEKIARGVGRASQR